MARRIKVGTDCSGMEAPIQALRNLKVKFEHEFSCDVNHHARATIEANFPHSVMYHDLTKRDNKSAPKVDLYVAGFPCQPFSLAGKRQGFKDVRGRGEVFFHVLDYIATVKPRVFILENVIGLVSLDGGRYLAAIMKELNGLKIYNVQWKILDTKKNGVPHHRQRWYCVGIHKDFDDGSFTFPEPIPCPSMDLFLERRIPKLAATGLPPKSASTAVRNVKICLRTLTKQGESPLKHPFIVDCDSSTYRFKWTDGFSPCITVGRSKGHWVSSRGRRMTNEEMMRLQGMDPTKFKVAVSYAQLGKQLGNTMSVNVIERLLARVLPASKLVRRGAVIDRWAKGQAVKALARTRGRGFAAIVGKKKAVSSKRAAAESTASLPPTMKRKLAFAGASAALKKAKKQRMAAFGRVGGH